jgi:hypothetical protein
LATPNAISEGIQISGKKIRNASEFGMLPQRARAGKFPARRFANLPNCQHHCSANVSNRILQEELTSHAIS